METILLVEDDPLEARTLVSLLAGEYKVIHCPELRRAPEATRRSAPAAVVLSLPSAFGLRVVGRYAGRYPKQMEASIVEAVKKATPSLLLVGAGVPGREKWIPRNLAHFNSGLYLWCSDLFDVFAERRSKPLKALFRNGLEWIPAFLRRPWRLHRAFIYLWYNVLLVVARLRRT